MKDQRGQVLAQKHQHGRAGGGVCPGLAHSIAPSQEQRRRGMETGWFPRRELFSG